MRKISVLIWFLFFGAPAFSQQWSGRAYGFMRGNLSKEKWHYGPVRKVNSLIDFKGERFTIKDSSGTVQYRLLKDVVTKRMDEDNCITSLRTGYDENNIRCMINLVEFNNGANVLNIMYASISYSYYFSHVDN